MRKTGVFALAALSASSVFSATYYWNRQDTDWHNWSDAANWLVDDGGAKVAATQAPGAGDVIKRRDTQIPEKMYVDLGAAEVEIGGINFAEGLWGADDIQLANGTLKLTDTTFTTSWFTPTKITLDHASLLLHSPVKLGHANNSDNSSMNVTIGEGSLLEFADQYWWARAEFHVNDGGTMRVLGTANPQNANANVEVPIQVCQGGVLDFEKGYNNFASSPWSYHPHVTLNGEWLLGGQVSYSNNIKFRAELASGTLKATNDASFNFHKDGGWGKFVDGADVTLEAVEGKTLDLSNFTYAGAATLTLQGAGTIKLPNEGAPTGIVLKDAQKYAVTATGAEMTMVGVSSADSTFTVGAANLSIGTLAMSAGRLVIQEPGLTVDTAIVETPAVFSVVGLGVGDAVITCMDTAFLATVQNKLAAAGVNTAIDGTTLKIAASEVKFDSTTVTNINDPTGWSNGAVPETGMSAQVLGKDVNIVVSDAASAIPAFSSLTIGEGATLTLNAEDAVVPCPLTLQAGAKLVLVQSASLTGLASDLGETGELNTVTVPEDVTLKVPGNTRFSNMSIDLKGAIAATSDGKLVFGYAKSGTTAKFAMTATGATITALNAAETENGSRIEFVCPAEGGVVEVLGPIVLNETTFTYNSMDGFAFGLNNPTDKPFTIQATKTDLNIGAETVVAGAANLVLEGSRLLRKRHSEGDTNDSFYNIVVQNKGRITVGRDSSIYAGVTRVNRDIENGAIRLQPDEAGYVGLEFLDGGTAHWYKANGYDKGAISFADATFEFTKAYWWGWGNRSHLFNRMTAVKLQEGKTLTFKCVKEGLYSSNNDTYTYFIMEAPFTGAGNLSFTSERSSQTMQPTIVRNDNACTGTLSVDPAAAVKVHFANGANWAGTVDLCGLIDLQPTDDDHMSESVNPAEVTFGAARLVGDFTIRLWGSDGFKNDRINVTGAGWSAVGESKLVFAIQDGYEPQQGDKWLIGTAPVAAPLPSVSEKWAFVTEPTAGEDGLVNIYLTPAAAEFNFVSNADGSTDLNDATAWSNGAVPTGKEVSVVGANVVAEINAEQGLPSFASISVKGGATLRINTDLSETVLPTIAVDAYSRIELTSGAVAKVPSMFTTNAKVVDETVSLAKIVVAADATLVVPAGTVFKNVDLEIYGTVRSEGSGTLSFGAANLGETAYFALKAEGATFDLPGQDNKGITTIDWLSPSSGGRIKAVGEIVLKDCQFPFTGWFDYHTQHFCVNNPTDEEVSFVWDNTVLQAAFATTIAGAAQMTFKNGAYLTRAAVFAGHGGDVTVSDAAVVTFEGQNSGMSFNTNTPQGLKLNTSVGKRDAIVLKDGASLNVRRVYASNGAGIAASGTGANLMVDKPNSHEYALYSGAKITVAEDATLRLLATNDGNVGSNEDRDVVFLGQFSGAGDVEIANLTDKKFNVLLMNGSDGFTGSVKVVPPVEETETNATTMTFAANDSVGLDWTGATLVLDSHVKMAEDGVRLTFGEVCVAEDYALRFETTAPAGMLDRINVTGAGFTGTGRLIVAVPESFNPGRTAYPFGTVAKGAALPKLKGSYWKVVTETVDGVTTCSLKRNLGFAIHFR